MINQGTIQGEFLCCIW